jgi:dUTP pyrophosphatase
MEIPLLKLDADLPTPSHSHPGDGGTDLYSRIDTVLEPRERQMVPTGIAVAIPEGYAGLVVPRSGLAVRHGIGVVNGPGLLDSGFRGEVSVILVNHGSEAFSLARGDRIAQLVITPIVVQEFVEVDELPPSTRGVGGFGSTGR